MRRLVDQQDTQALASVLTLALVAVVLVLLAAGALGLAVRVFVLAAGL